MDNQQFDTITRLAAKAPDRRKALKLAGAAALLGTAGFLSRSDDAGAKLITVVITNLLNNLSVDIDVRNNKVAVQICAAVDALNTTLVGGDVLHCEINQ